jgi:hypothetical protein
VTPAQGELSPLVARLLCAFNGLLQLAVGLLLNLGHAVLIVLGLLIRNPCLEQLVHVVAG